MNINHFGDVLPNYAFFTLQLVENSYLVDVRTDEEWKNVGVPDLSNIDKKVIFLSWRLAPSMDLNKEFIPTLTGLITNKNSMLYFLCRSGSRSAKAAEAALNAKYKLSYNIMYGFEGELMGWKALNLPWRHF